MVWRLFTSDTVKASARQHYNDDYPSSWLGSKDKPISRREYDNIRRDSGQITPISQRAHAAQVLKQQAYNRRALNYVETQRAAGKPITLGEARKSAELKAINKSFRKLNKKVKVSHGKIVNFRDTPEGRTELKNILVALGRRTNVADWVPPGLSERYRAGKLRRDRIPKAYRME